MICETCGHDNLEGARFCANCGATLAVATDAGHPLVGKVVGGRYRVTGVIGEGGMGVVYEAEQQMGTALRKVALKTLHAELSRDPAVTARFHRECGTVAQLEHPNTIKVYDFGAMDDGTLYIVMEYLAGRPLDQVIEQEGPLPAERVLHLVRQMAGSLEEAHHQGIIHRDLKPENVILIERAGERDVVKLLDFGIAARTESTDAAREAKLTQQGMVLGTPPYMSPEQFTGKALDRRSDVYSLAVMVYQMLTAHLPFDADTPWEWATQHMTAEPKEIDTFGIAAEVPAAMKEAIRRGLAKDREERFASAREFVEALEGSGAGAAKDHSAAAMMATAAMEEAPEFAAAGPAPTAAMPEVTPKPQQAVAAVPPAPARAQPAHGKQHRGLVLGLGGLALLLAGGIALAVVSDGRDGGADGDPLVQIPTATSIAPLDEPAEANTTSEQTAELASTAAEPPEQAPQTPPAVVAPAPKPAVVPKPRPAPAPAPQPKPAPEPSPAPRPSAGDPCELCRASALSGNVASAAVYYRKCTDAAKKDACAKRARDGATNAAIAAAKQNDCSKANQIRIFANQMGAGSPRLDAAVNACKK